MKGVGVQFISTSSWCWDKQQNSVRSFVKIVAEAFQSLFSHDDAKMGTVRMGAEGSWQVHSFALSVM
jgi:hypothetical protein